MTKSGQIIRPGRAGPAKILFKLAILSFLSVKYLIELSYIKIGVSIADEQQTAIKKERICGFQSNFWFQIKFEPICRSSQDCPPGSLIAVFHQKDTSPGRSKKSNMVDEIKTVICFHNGESMARTFSGTRILFLHKL